MAGVQVQIKAGVRVQPVAGCNYLNLTGILRQPGILAQPGILGPRTSPQTEEAQASSSRPRPSMSLPFSVQ